MAIRARFGHMKTKTTGLILALCFFGTACFADDPQVGIWKLNEAKSKFAPGVPKNHTVVIEAAGDNVKITVDGIDRDGKSTHNEWTGRFDGKDYPVTGDPTSDMRSYTNVANRLLKMTIKKDGKVTVTGRIVLSADGKSRIVTTSEAGAEGKSLRNRSVSKSSKRENAKFYSRSHRAAGDRDRDARAQGRFQRMVKFTRSNAPANSCIALFSSINAVSYSSPRTTNRFPSPRCASGTKIVRPSSLAGATGTLPAFHTANPPSTGSTAPVE